MVQMRGSCITICVDGCPVDRVNDRLEWRNGGDIPMEDIERRKAPPGSPEKAIVFPRKHTCA